MDAVNIYEAKTRLSQLVDQAAGGDDVVIGRHGKAVARLTRLAEPQARIRFGVLKGSLQVPDDFDDALPDEFVASFGAG